MSDIRTPDEIEREIEANREGLQGTLRALETTFTPDSIFRSITDNVGRHGDEFGKSAMDAAKGNPLALGLTAVGLCWLMFGKGPSADRLDREARQAVNGKDRHGAPSTDPAASLTPRGPVPKGTPGTEPTTAQRARAGWYRTEAHVRSGAMSVSDGAQSARDGAANAAGRVRDRSEAMARSLSEGTEKMNAQARERILAARERAILAGEEAERKARRGANRGADFFEENPLVAGALAMAAGALVAGSLPRTQMEDEHLGPHSDRLYEDAEKLFEEERAKLERVAGAAADEARTIGDEVRADADEAGRRLKDDADRNTRGEGSAADAAVDRTEEAAQRIATAAERQAEKEDLGPRRG
ncbi:DUF3618 domain-containing protein [Allosediminivita pacifica]|uniref:Uncharacterized protein DUF3618 n=1 Tax=Allosediminivita pacifica TaxID=1267769 RepID=A0A2T5ZYV0_9RHOB|nr:DUF3618 domain-containing protein [Allosediminivita pacifica]PTX36751.1 uncharacterized protein DUF3618 [Allosediminivita pacifica]GGB30541.1 hypothetical protein GCM10011324_45080 [Allosediminivita pacifica]